MGLNQYYLIRAIKFKGTLRGRQSTATRNAKLVSEKCLKRKAKDTKPRLDSQSIQREKDTPRGMALVNRLVGAQSTEFSVPTQQQKIPSIRTTARTKEN